MRSPNVTESESSGKKCETPARKLGSLVGELGSKTVASLSQSGGNRARQRTHFAPVGFGCASYKSNSPGDVTPIVESFGFGGVLADSMHPCSSSGGNEGIAVTLRPKAGEESEE